jgi:hypothetical protein
MLALYICVFTGLVVWLWLVWDMTREFRAGWGRGEGLKASFKGGLRKPALNPRKQAPEPEPEPPPPPARDPRDWMSE